MNQKAIHRLKIESKLQGIPESLGKQLEVSFNSPVLNTFSISIAHISADLVVIEYNSTPGNLPDTFGNYVAIWPQTVIPWGTKPIAQTPLEMNNEDGSVILSGMTITSSSYIVGYANGPDATDFVASATISAGGATGNPLSVNIGLDYVATNSVAVNYHTLPGYQPSTNGNWVGIWKGYYSPYSNNSKPEGSVQIPKNNTEGSVGISNITLGINSEYTVVYFMGKEYSTAAAILNFKTGGETRE